MPPFSFVRGQHSTDVDVERKQAQAIASLPDSITHYYAYSNEDFTVISQGGTSSGSRHKDTDKSL